MFDYSDVYTEGDPPIVESELCLGTMYFLDNRENRSYLIDRVAAVPLPSVSYLAEILEGQRRLHNTTHFQVGSHERDP